MLNSVGERTPPCGMPVLNFSESLLHICIPIFNILC